MLRLKKTMDELGRVSPEEFRKLKKKPVVVILDNVRSAHNVGSVFRTCDAFLAEKVFLCGITPIPPNSEIQKTALGATEHVEWEYFSKTSDIISDLKNNRYKIYSVEQAHNSIHLSDIELENNSKTALIFGNEVYGIDQEIIDISDFCIEIPQMGTKHSLNVSVCAGIIIHHFAKYYKG